MKKFIALMILLIFGPMAFGIEITPLAAENNHKVINKLKDTAMGKEVRRKGYITKKVGGVEVTQNNTDLKCSYVVRIKGQKYYMVKNKPNNDYKAEDILGYYDDKTSLFNDLKNLNSDMDNTEISYNELKKADIRFVALKDGKLQLQDIFSDYNLNYVVYISLKNLRGVRNNGKIDSYGYFDVFVKEKNATKKIIGVISFETEEVLNDIISQ